jgi:hypothetical protein
VRILEKAGTVDAVGKSFGVIKLTLGGQIYDFSLPQSIKSLQAVLPPGVGRWRDVYFGGKFAVGAVPLCHLPEFDGGIQEKRSQLHSIF